MVNQEQESSLQLSTLARLFYQAWLFHINTMVSEPTYQAKLLQSGALGREILLRQFILENLVPLVLLPRIKQRWPLRQAADKDLELKIRAELGQYTQAQSHLSPDFQLELSDTIEFMIETLIQEVKIVPLAESNTSAQPRQNYVELIRKLQFLRRVFGYNAPSIDDGD